MRLLGDENFPQRFLKELRAEGHDVTSALTNHRGTPDKGLLEIAERESRILLTLDKDYLKLMARRRTPLKSAGVILFRIHPATIPALRPLVLYFRNAAHEWTGRVTVITRSPGGQISVRHP
jgi:predicted nuclease of predicted toxin-antitoxin system